MVKIPKHQRESLFRRYENGERVVNLADEFQVTRGSISCAIREYCKANNIVPTSKPFRPPKKDLTGLTFGKLEVLCMLHPIDNQGHYRCKCVCRSCGNEDFILKVKDLDKRINPTCGCETWERKKGKASSRFRGHEEISGNFWNYLLRNARQRNIAVNITIEQAWDLYIQQNRKCALSGAPIDFGTSNYDATTASLDRINPHLDYELGNIQWLHKNVNFSKHRMDNDEFIKMCKQIVNHHEITYPTRV